MDRQNVNSSRGSSSIYYPLKREFPGLEVLIEALREDIGLLDMAIRDIPKQQHEILYSTLLGMSPEERHRLLRICITHGPEDRSFLIETIGSGLIDKRTGLYNRTKFNTDLQAAIEVVDGLYRQREFQPLFRGSGQAPDPLWPSCDKKCGRRNR